MRNQREERLYGNDLALLLFAAVAILLMLFFR
jgi:hypothetical protein